MNKNKYPQLHNIEWLKKTVKDKSLHQIAKEVGCSYSGVVYVTRLYKIDVPKHRTYTLTPEHYQKMLIGYKKKYPNGRYGKEASNWRGGRRISSLEYFQVYCPNHPNATKQGYVMEHRLIAEKKIGRYLKPNEVVHHINHNKLDNRSENLEVYSRSDHVHEHYDYGNKLVEENERLKKLLADNDIKY